MKSVMIKLSLAENVKDFVNIVSSFGCDTDLKSGRYVVDAKSILGIFSLDLASPIEVIFHTNDADEYIKQLKAFIV